MSLRTVCFGGLLLALLQMPTIARADIYALAHDAADNATALRSTTTVQDTALRVANCCAIANGSVTFDTAGNRAFFIAQNASGAELVRWHYLSGQQARLPLSGPYRVTHLEYDPVSGLLLALARDEVDDRLLMAAIHPLTAQLSVRAVLAEPCCVLKTGVSALLMGGSTRLLTVGRSGGEESLLVFDFSTNTGPQIVAVPAGLQIAELAVHPVSGATFGFAHRSSDNLGFPVSLAAAPGYAISLIGAGVEGCCFALAGAASIDGSSNELVLIGSDSAAGPTTLQRFQLQTGLRSSGLALSAHALFEDSGVRFDLLFADGFEQGIE